MGLNNILDAIYKTSNLKFKLKEAGMTIDPKVFIRKTIKTSLMQATAITIIVGFASIKTRNYIMPIIAFIVTFYLSYLMYSKTPDIAIKKIEKDIDREIIFAGRFIIVELQSGISIYDSMKNTIEAYPAIGKYFRQIIDKVDMGITVEKALNQIIEITPSRNFRRILWQTLNSLKTGTNIATSINSVVELIVKEQMISLNEYAKKLNPLAMFYMVIAVIFPSLGVTVGIIFSSFVGIKMNIPILIIVAGFIGIIQFIFYNMIKNQRPAIEM